MPSRAPPERVGSRCESPRRDVGSPVDVGSGDGVGDRDRLIAVVCLRREGQDVALLAPGHRRHRTEVGGGEVGIIEVRGGGACTPPVTARARARFRPHAPVLEAGIDAGEHRAEVACLKRDLRFRGIAWALCLLDHVHGHDAENDEHDRERDRSTDRSLEGFGSAWPHNRQSVAASAAGGRRWETLTRPSERG